MIALFKHDILSSGLSTSLFALTLYLWAIAIGRIIKRDLDTAFGMMTIVWLIAMLRACLHMFNAVLNITVADSSLFNISLFHLHRLSLMLCIPLLEAVALCLLLVIPVLYTKTASTPVRIEGIWAVLGGFGSLLVVYLSWVFFFTMQPAG